MSLKSLLAEISTGVWLLENPNPQSYREIIAGLRSGVFTQEASAFHKVIGEPIRDSDGQLMLDDNGDPQMKDKVAVISLIGELTKYSAMCNVGADMICARLLKYNADDSIKAIILKMDGPGGNASVIPMFQELRNQMTKPVVSLVESACSLHYYIAAVLSSRIVMANDFTACAGSVGAMIMFEKPERELVIVRPPQSKDKNQDLIDALAGDTTLLEEKLIPLATRFQEDVRAARLGVSEEALFGKVLYAKDAIATGLADSIGTMQDAYKIALTLSELQTV